MSNPFNTILDAFASMNVDTVSELQYGRVDSIDPLAISVNGRDPLPGSFFELSDGCKRYKTKIRAEGGGWSEVEIDNSLQVGDRVILLSFNKNQKYFAAGRT